MFNPQRVIAAKRDGYTLASKDITALVNGFVRGDVPPYQMSAFLMAAFLRGLSNSETASLTECMLHSGKVLDLSDLPGTKVDKHSTGGVGDSVSLILAPTVAACGVPVPMISGRGLGHTGGTIDKLHSIPGLRTNLSTSEYRRQLEAIGVVIGSATKEIAPADRELYALRDVTSTVASIPLIAASIMSKKLAAGLDALVLDVKVGAGAFMSTVPEARRLAETLARIGERFGKPTVAWITRMDVPLGHCVGNRLEIDESVQCLKGDGPQDLMKITLTLSGEMICLGGLAATPDEGIEMAREAIRSGKALATFTRMVQAQGGSLDFLEPSVLCPAATVRAPRGVYGFIADIDAYAIARTSVNMGVGRISKEDDVDPEAGIVLRKKPGEEIAPGDALADLYTTRTNRLTEFSAAVSTAFQFSDKPPIERSRLVDRLEANEWAIG